MTKPLILPDDAVGVLFYDEAEDIMKVWPIGSGQGSLFAGETFIIGEPLECPDCGYFDDAQSFDSSGEWDNDMICWYCDALFDSCAAARRAERSRDLLITVPEPVPELAPAAETGG